MTEEADENNMTPIPELSDLAPEAGGDYWANIDARLEAVAANQAESTDSSSANSDTESTVIRLNDMTNNGDANSNILTLTPTAIDEEPSSNRLFLAVAAALILFVAFGAFSLFTNDDPTPINTAEATEPDQSGTAEGGTGEGATEEQTEPVAVEESGSTVGEPRGFWLLVAVEGERADEIPTDAAFGPLLSITTELVQDNDTLQESEENLLSATDSCGSSFGLFSYDDGGAFAATEIEAFLDVCESGEEFTSPFVEGVANATEWSLTVDGSLVLTGPGSRFEFVPSNEFGDNLTDGSVPAERAQLNFSRFETPDGNIQCGWDSQNSSLTCRIAEHTWTILPADIPENGNCSADFGSEVTLSIGGEPQFTCVEGISPFLLDFNGEPAIFETLPVENTRGFGSISCSTDGASLSCFDQETGATFTLESDVYPFDSEENAIEDPGTDRITLAEQFTTFGSPSGNIQCGWDNINNGLICRILEHSWEIRDADIPLDGFGGDELCQADFGSEIALAPGSQPGFTCIGDVQGYIAAADPGFNDGVNGFDPLPFGESIDFGTINCLSEETGLTCTDTTTGAFFTMARDIYPLPQDDGNAEAAISAPDLDTQSEIDPVHLVSLTIPDGWTFSADEFSVQVESDSSFSRVQARRVSGDLDDPLAEGDILLGVTNPTVFINEGSPVTATDWNFSADGEQVRVVRYVPLPSGDTVVIEMFGDGADSIVEREVPFAVLEQVRIFN